MSNLYQHAYFAGNATIFAALRRPCAILPTIWANDQRRGHT